MSAKRPFWKTIMIFGLPASVYASVKLWDTEYGLLSFFLFPVTLWIMAAAKAIHEDNIFKSQDPNYIRAIDIAKPVGMIWLIFKSPVIILFIVGAIYTAYEVWGT